MQANNGRHLAGKQRINWKTIRRGAKKRLAVHRAFAVMHHEPHTDAQRRFRAYMRSSGFCVVAAIEEVFWHTPVERPVDVWTDFWLSVESDHGNPPNSIVVVTHRPYIAPTLEKLLSRGANVTIVGFVGFFHPDLMDLADHHPHCRVLDIELDFHAVQLPLRWKAPNVHTYQHQLALRAN